MIVWRSRCAKFIGARKFSSMNDLRPWVNCLARRKCFDTRDSCLQPSLSALKTKYSSSHSSRCVELHSNASYKWIFEEMCLLHNISYAERNQQSNVPWSPVIAWLLWSIPLGATMLPLLSEWSKCKQLYIVPTLSEGNNDITLGCRIRDVVHTWYAPMLEVDSYVQKLKHKLAHRRCQVSVVW